MLSTNWTEPVTQLQHDTHSPQVYIKLSLRQAMFGVTELVLIIQ